MLRDILHYPDPRLHTVAKAVTQFDDALAALTLDMAQTMYHAKGVGLAATQINIHQRIIVVDVSDERDQLLVLVNPEIVTESPQMKKWEEGCLSTPDIYDTVMRPDLITVKAQDITGQAFSLEADGLLSVCIQHEIDHLNGILFVQHLSSLKQQRIRSKVLKRIREVEPV